MNASLTQGGADRFFRPLGYWSYYVDSLWAGWSPVRWHLLDILLHLANCFLIFGVAKKMGLTAQGALIATAIFAFHGSHVEAVAWLAARFDLLAAFFVLLGVYLFLEYMRTTSAAYLCWSVACCALSLLCKEAAYCFPLLLFPVLGFRKAFSKRGLQLILPYFLVTFIAFIYRWSVVGGIGGYQANGHATILEFHLILTLKALLLRMWAVLFYPVNWSRAPGITLGILGLLYAAALVVLSLTARKSSWNVRLLIATAIAALPVQHLLLLGASLEGSRVYYLPSALFALFLGSLFSNRNAYRIGLVAAALVTFQAGALIHNLIIWESVAQLAQKTCHEIGDAVKRTSKPVIVSGIPGTIDGVYFFANGLPQCVEHVANRRNIQVYTDQSRAIPGQNSDRFIWDRNVRTLTRPGP